MPKEDHSVREPPTGGGMATPPAVDLSARSAEYHIDEPTLKVRVATQVLKLFKWSLIGTLCSSAVILITDEFFIFYKVITPDQRLLTEKVLMTLIGATVVQVGAALAAIVYAVFKSTGSDRDPAS